MACAYRGLNTVHTGHCHSGEAVGAVGGAGSRHRKGGCLELVTFGPRL